MLSITESVHMKIVQCCFGMTAAELADALKCALKGAGLELKHDINTKGYGVLVLERKDHENNEAIH